MADAISDNRTQLDPFDATTNVTNVAGATAGTVDTDTAIEGATPTSITFNLTSAIQGLLYDNGTIGFLSAGDHLYHWVNVGVAGLLLAKASGGLRYRFCGATPSDFFEAYVAGSDTYTGGWRMFVIDVSAVQASPDNTGGTPPSIANVQYCGFVGDTGGAMTKKQDNFWVDSLWQLASATPGILVEGDNAAANWSWADVLAASITGAWGTAQESPGGTIILNTPIRIGTNDATTHGFLDTNSRLEWADEPVNAGLYGITVVGGSGTQSCVMGIKTGTGDDATGAQGVSIAAKAAGVRWFFDGDDANIDALGLYGCNFSHGADFQLDGANVETISTIMRDCTSATVSGSRFQRVKVIDANTADDVSFCFTDDLTDLRYCEFEFSDGHAVELVTPRVAAQTSKGNRFIGYGTTTSTDAAIYNQTAGAVAISTTSGATVGEHTYKDGTSASTTVTGAVSLTVTPIVVGSEVRAYRYSDDVEVDGVESAAGTSQALTLVSGQAVNIVVMSYDPPKIPVRIENKSFSVDQDLDPFQRDEPNFNNP